MTKQLVLANPVESAIKPKPTKKEIVDALVQLKIQEHITHNKALDERREKLKKMIDTKARRFATRNPSKAKVVVSVRDYYNPPKIEVEFEISNYPDDLRVLTEEWVKLGKERSYIDEKRVRRRIMEGLQMISPSGDRVAALLKAPESRKALQAILKEIE